MIEGLPSRRVRATYSAEVKFLARAMAVNSRPLEGHHLRLADRLMSQLWQRWECLDAHTAVYKNGQAVRMRASE